MRADRQNRDGDFSLPPSERAVYGATITARSLETGKTRTFVRTETTAVEATREIVAELDLLADDFRVLCVSTPNSIQRDIYASRIALEGAGVGYVGPTPEQGLLSRIKRLDMLHPSIVRMSDGNKN